MGGGAAYLFIYLHYWRSLGMHDGWEANESVGFGVEPVFWSRLVAMLARKECLWTKKCEIVKK